MAVAVLYVCVCVCVYIYMFNSCVTTILHASIQPFFPNLSIMNLDIAILEYDQTATISLCVFIQTALFRERVSLIEINDPFRFP